MIVDDSTGSSCPSMVMMTPGEVGFDVVVIAVLLGKVGLASTTGTTTGTMTGAPRAGSGVAGGLVAVAGGLVTVTERTRTNGTALVVVVELLRAASTLVGETKATAANTSAPPAQPPQMTADRRDEAFIVDHEIGPQ